MDDFLQKALPAAKPGLVVVDSSEGVSPLRLAAMKCWVSPSVMTANRVKNIMPENMAMIRLLFIVLQEPRVSRRKLSTASVLRA